MIFTSPMPFSSEEKESAWLKKSSAPTAQRLRDCCLVCAAVSACSYGLAVRAARPCLKKYLTITMTVSTDVQQA
jgi:hypothetical protein